RPVPRDLAAPADDHLYPRDRSFARCKHLCNDRDHALRVLAMNDDQGRGERRAQLVVAGAIALGVVIRLLAVRAQGFPTDVGTFEAWAERLAQIGPGRFYEPGYFSDYPPAFLYVLWLLGALFDGELLRLAVKAISIPADIGIALLAAYVLCVPFWGLDPTHIAGELALLVRSASETYPYTSLYAFNAWSVFFDFWKPDESLFLWGGVLLGIGLIASAIPLWWRRDTAVLLACAIFAGLAFYFLPTRAHERYLFPVFALALPLAAARKRVLVPYLVLALTFALSLYYAFTRYQQYVDLRVPEIIEATVFSRAGQIGLALVMMGAAAYLVWRLVRGDARLESDTAWDRAGAEKPGRRPWSLPAG